MRGWDADRIIGAIGRLPGISALVRLQRLRHILEGIPLAHALFGSGWERTHPYDRAYGTDTSGVVSTVELPAGDAADHAICYAGSQPSVVRSALDQVPGAESCTFIDLGCGKGRALLVASERPYRDIVGVELSPALAAIARRNAARLHEAHPLRTRIRVIVGDASAWPLPPGDLVIFMYHPFTEELVAKVVARIEAALSGGNRSIHVVYYNPVAGHRFDASPALRRHFAGELPYAREERGFGPDETDTVVIWRGGGVRKPTGAAGAHIVLAEGGLRASLGDS